VLALALAALTLVPPVPGAVTRGFAYAGDPFAAGHHRGVDLAAASGMPVRAACGGRVVFAGRAGENGRAVTIRCGRFNVTHLPLATLATAAGANVHAGAMLGTATSTRGHDGLHLGVRRASDPLGYVDPAPLLHGAPPPAPPAAPRAKPRRPTSPPPHPEPLPSAPHPHASPLTRIEPLRGTEPMRGAPPPRPAPVPAAPSPRAEPAHHPGSSPLAPWPAWAGLALLLAGATGAGAAKRARKRRAVLTQPRAAPVR
jgi:Peptidase family M23